MPLEAPLPFEQDWRGVVRWGRSCPGHHHHLGWNPGTLIKTGLLPDPILPSHSPPNEGPSEPRRLIKKASEGFVVSQHLPPAPTFPKRQREVLCLSSLLGRGPLPCAVGHLQFWSLQGGVSFGAHCPHQRRVLSQLQPPLPTHQPIWVPNLGSPFSGGVSSLSPSQAVTSTTTANMTVRGGQGA